MKKFIVILIILLLGSEAAFTQGFIKTAEDTAFLMDRVYFPQLQIKLSISFLTDDFSSGKKAHYNKHSLDSLENLVKQNPKNGDNCLTLSSAYYNFNRNQEGDSLNKRAKDLFMQDMMKNPADTHAIKMIASILVGQNETELAKAYYKELIRLAPASSEGWSGYAMVSMGNYQIDTARKYMEKAIAVEPGNIGNYCQMANLMMLKAIWDLSFIDSTKLDSLPYTGLVDTRFLNDAIKKDPKNPVFSGMMDALNLTAMIYQAFIDNAEKLTGHGDTLKWHLREMTKKDMIAIEKRMELNAKTTFHDREFPYSCLMLIAFLDNDPDRALQWFDKGIIWSPGSQNMYENITGICALSMRKSEAFKLQMRLDSLHPTNANYLMTAYFYYLDKKFKECQDWTLKVLKTDPNNFDALMGMAALKTRFRQFDDAAAYLNKAAKINPMHMDVRFLNGILLMFDNAPQMAKSIFTTIQKDYRGPEVDEIMNRFFTAKN